MFNKDGMRPSQQDGKSTDCSVLENNCLQNGDGVGGRLNFTSSSESSLHEDEADQDTTNTATTSRGQPRSKKNPDRKTGGKKRKAKKADPPTIVVRFVDQTPEGRMAKKLQEVEDRLAQDTG